MRTFGIQYAEPESIRNFLIMNSLDGYGNYTNLDMKIYKPCIEASFLCNM